MENQSGEQHHTTEQPAANPDSSWSYTPSADSEPAPSSLPSLQPITWTASEFVDHDKRVTWFLGLAGISALVAGVAYLVTQDIVTSVVIVIAAALFGITAGRKPNTLEYHIDNKGVKIGPKFYAYAQFRSFSVLEEGAIGSIQLMPVGRFAPPISLYYPPNQEDQIINTLGSYLPHEDHKRDVVDRFMNKIRF